MTKAEFLEQLRQALQGNLGQALVNEHLHYYENYIIEESRKGRSEQEVIDSLGNPRLIAHTLIETSEHVGNGYDETYYEESNTRHAKRQRGFHIDVSEDGKWDIRYGRFKLNSWYGILLLAIIFLIIIVIVGHLMVFLLPIILVVMGVSLLIRWILSRKE